MRRSLSILVAAAMLAGASTASVFPAQAATPAMPVAGSTQGGSIEQVRDRRHHDGRGWRGDDNWRYRHHRHHRRHYDERAYFPQPFYFGFPFAMARPYHRYGGYQRDCFRTWDGQLICR